MGRASTCSAVIAETKYQKTTNIDVYKSVCDGHLGGSEHTPLKPPINGLYTKKIFFLST